jgi:hypothetical protein
MPCNIYNIQAKNNTAFHKIFHMHFRDKELLAVIQQYQYGKAHAW